MTGTVTAATINRTLNRGARRVLKHVAECSGATHLGVAAQVLGFSFGTIERHVNALAAAGLVEIACCGLRIPEGVEASDVFQLGGEVFWTQKVVPDAAWVAAEVKRTSLPPYDFRITQAGKRARR